MLVNVNYGRNTTSQLILQILGQGGEIVNPQVGIYITPSFSFGNDILQKHESYPDFDTDYEYQPYGVCDNVEQVLEHYKQWLELPDRNFCISFTKVKKSEQPSNGGWRWHKWGKYIGDKTPEFEYLYDENDSIQEIYCYHIYEIINE